MLPYRSLLPMWKAQDVPCSALQPPAQQALAGHFASVTSCLGPGLLSEMLRELQHAPTGHLTLANLSIKFWRLQDK